MKAALRTARREHMQRRARERFGLEAGKLVQRELVRKVQRGDVKFARKLTHSRTVIVADHEGLEVTFVYSSRTKGILTFLPADARETAVWRETAARRASRNGKANPATTA